MSKVSLIVVGAILTVFGIIFMLQGFGTIGGSAMSGVTLWAILGPIIALIGIGVAIVGLRRPARPPR